MSSWLRVRLTEKGPDMRKMTIRAGLDYAVAPDLDAGRSRKRSGRRDLFTLGKSVINRSCHDMTSINMLFCRAAERGPDAAAVPGVSADAGPPRAARASYSADRPGPTGAGRFGRPRP